VVALAQCLLTMGRSDRYSRIVWLHLDQALDPR